MFTENKTQSSTLTATLCHSISKMRVSCNFFFFHLPFFFIYHFFFICGEFCHTFKWNSQGFTCVPHPNPPSHLPLHPFPLGFPSVFQTLNILMYGALYIFNICQNTYGKVIQYTWCNINFCFVSISLIFDCKTIVHIHLSDVHSLNK